MKNKLFQFVLITALLFPMFGFSQTPGYLGKKLSVSYDLGAYPNYIEYIRYFDGGDSFDDGINFVYFSHGLGLDYCVGKKTEISFKLKFSKSQKTNSYEEYDYWDGNDYFEEIHDTKAMSFDFGLNYYLKNYIAPVGDFMRFSMFYTNLSDNTREAIENDISGIINNTIKEKTSGSVFGVGFGMYRKRIIKDRITLTAGFNFVLSSSLKHVPLEGYYNSNINYENNIVSYNELGYKNELEAHHSFSHGFINFTLAIGFLAF